MEELENGNTKADEETQEIEPKITPYGISEKGNDFPEPENEIPKEENEDLLDTELGADYKEPLAATSYSEEQLNDTTTEVVVENETQQDLEETNDVSVFPVAETEETTLLETSDGNIPRSENSKNVEDELNTPVDTENREIEQTPISANPSLAQRTSWGSCCGLFQLLRLSDN